MEQAEERVLEREERDGHTLDGRDRSGAVYATAGGCPSSHPIHIPGVPDQGLPEPTPVPPDQVTDPEIPAEFNDDLVIAVKQPGSEEWTYSAYSVQPDQGQPAPTPQAAPHRRR